MPIPGQDAPEVAPQAPGAARVDTDPTAVPQALSQAGATVEHISTEFNAMAVRERRMAAQLKATEAELDTGTKIDAAVSDFKSLGGLAPIQQIGDYQKKIEDLRSEGLNSLTDPWAKKQYEIRTRLQVQAALRHMSSHANEQVDQWQEKTVDGRIAQSIKSAGNLITGELAGDMKMVAEQSAMAVPDLVSLMRQRGIPEEAIQAKVEEVEQKILNSALMGYLAKDNTAAGAAFLNSKFAGTQTSVRDLLGAKDSASWQNTFQDRHNEKVGAGLGLEWMLDGVKDPIAKAREYVNQGPPEEQKFREAQAIKAVHEVYSLRSAKRGDEAANQAAEFNDAYETVANKFNRSVDAAQDAHALMGVSTQTKDRIRQLMAKQDDDPSFAEGLAQFGDVKNAGPGWSDHWPSEVQFKNQWLPLVGPKNYHELRQRYDQDQQRPKEQDSMLAHETQLFDIRLRQALDFAQGPMGENQYWSAAAPWQVNLHEWAEREWFNGVQAHHAEVKAGKRTDPRWAQQLQQQILQGMLGAKYRPGVDHADSATKLPAPIFTTRPVTPLPPATKAYLRGWKLTGQTGSAQRFPGVPAGEPPNVPEDLESPEGKAWLQSPAGQEWLNEPAE